MADISRIAKGAQTVLLPYQVRWLADTAPVKVAEKSRRVGITWTEAADSVLNAAAQNGCDTWYLGYNKEMAREFIATAASWARQFNKAVHGAEQIAVEDERRDLLAYRIKFSSGHKIVALSSRPASLRGKQGRAVIDEAAFHDDLPELMKAALAFTLWGGAVRVISTHNGAHSYFNELVTEIRAGRKDYSLHRITLDDAIADGLFHRICQIKRIEWSSAREEEWRAEIFAQYGEDADEELLCVPKASGGAYLPSLLIESRMADAPVVRWETAGEFAQLPDAERSRAAQDFCEERLGPALAGLDRNARSFFGEDFGRSGDLTVIWPLQFGADLRRHTPLVVELRNIPFKQQEEILFYLVDRLPRFSGGAMDARGNGQYLAERAMQRYGARIRQVMLTAEWYRDNMPRYKAAFEDRLFDLPRDAELLSDHRAITVTKGIARVAERRSVDRRGRTRHGDAAIAGALAYYASCEPAGEYGYRAVKANPAAAIWEAEFMDETQAATRRRGRFGSAGTW